MPTSYGFVYTSPKDGGASGDTKRGQKRRRFGNNAEIPLENAHASWVNCLHKIPYANFPCSRGVSNVAIPCTPWETVT